MTHEERLKRIEELTQRLLSKYGREFSYHLGAENDPDLIERNQLSLTHFWGSWPPKNPNEKRDEEPT